MSKYPGIKGRGGINVYPEKGGWLPPPGPRSTAVLKVSAGKDSYNA